MHANGCCPFAIVPGIAYVAACAYRSGKLGGRVQHSWAVVDCAQTADRHIGHHHGRGSDRAGQIAAIGDNQRKGQYGRRGGRGKCGLANGVIEADRCPTHLLPTVAQREWAIDIAAGAAVECDTCVDKTGLAAPGVGYGCIVDRINGHGHLRGVGQCAIAQGVSEHVVTVKVERGRVTHGGPIGADAAVGGRSHRRHRQRIVVQVTVVGLHADRDRRVFVGAHAIILCVRRDIRHGHIGAAAIVAGAGVGNRSGDRGGVAKGAGAHVTDNATHRDRAALPNIQRANIPRIRERTGGCDRRAALVAGAGQGDRQLIGNHHIDSRLRAVVGVDQGIGQGLAGYARAEGALADGYIGLDVECGQGSIAARACIWVVGRYIAEVASARCASHRYTQHARRDGIVHQRIKGNDYALARRQCAHVDRNCVGRRGQPLCLHRRSQRLACAAMCLRGSRLRPRHHLGWVGQRAQQHRRSAGAWPNDGHGACRSGTGNEARRVIVL